MLAFYTLAINFPIPSLTPVVVLALLHVSGWIGLVRFLRDWHWPLCTRPLVVCMPSWENFAHLCSCVICLFIVLYEHSLCTLHTQYSSGEIINRLMGNCDSVWVWSAWKCVCCFVYIFLYKTMENLYNLNFVITSCTMIIWDSASNQTLLSNTLTLLSLPQLGLYKA